MKDKQDFSVPEEKDTLPAVEEDNGTVREETAPEAPPAAEDGDADQAAGSAEEAETAPESKEEEHPAGQPPKQAEPLKAKEKSRLRLRALFDNNYFVMIFALLCAFGYWLSIASTSDSITRVISDVPIIYRLPQGAEDQGLKVIENTAGASIKTVNVTITGKRYIVGQVTSSDISVVASVDNVSSPGTYTATIKAEATGRYKDFVIESIDPAFVQLRLDRTTEREYQLTAQATNEYTSPEGITLKQPTAAVPTVIIEGPESDLKQIARVVAQAKVDDVISQTTSYTGNIVLYDDFGAVIENPALKLNITQTEVTVVAMQLKEIPLELNYINVPESFGDIKVKISPSSIPVAVPTDIETVEPIVLGTVDFSQINADNTSFEFEIKLPTGYVNESDTTTATVDFVLSGMRTREFDVNRIVVDGDREGIKLEVVTKTINKVLITGPAEQVELLTNDDIVAHVDMEKIDNTSGKHEITVTIEIKNGSKCWVYGTPTVFVQVKK